MNTNIMILGMIMLVSLYMVKNPIKMTMTLLALSGLLFILMNLKSGESWLPLIFFLLFMGGILMMFMIVSSILPNEKTSSMKKSIFSISMLYLMALTLMKEKTPNVSSLFSIKSILESNMNLIFLIFLMTSYFLIFMYMLSKESSSMRKTLCYK